MPNQRAIAAALGLTQATVSMALRNDPGIALKTRELVHATAEKLGYKANPYVASLMARIRSGRPVPDKGCIGVLFACAKHEEWMSTETYKTQYAGIMEKASNLGFHVEAFCLRARDLTVSRIERMLYTRGINGLILSGAATDGERQIALKWERYSVAAIAYDWSLPWVDRVASHHRHNVEAAFRSVAERGYRRIGMCFPPEGWKGVDSSWQAGYYIAREALPRAGRVPPFIGKPGVTPLSVFRDWYTKWKPDALVTLIGHELEYLREMGLSVPGDIGIACVNRPAGSRFAGVEENHFHVGTTVAELVISGILRNEYGPPSHHKLILVEGSWTDGATLRPAGAAPDSFADGDVVAGNV